MFHFVHPAFSGHYNLPSRTQNFNSYHPQRRGPTPHHAGPLASQLATLTAENDQLEARIAALEQRAQYEDAIAREHKRREIAARRLDQLEARQAQTTLPRSFNPVQALHAPQDPVAAHWRQACGQGGPALGRRGACRRRSDPPAATATDPVNEVVDFLNTIFGGNDQPQPQPAATKPAKATTETKEDTNHLAELLRRRDKFMSLFTDKPVKPTGQPASPTASGSNVKLSDTLSASPEAPASTLHARSIASASLNSLSNQFTSLKSAFIIPSAPPAGFEFKKPTSDSSPTLAFNPINAPILEYEQQLTKVLGKADEVDSSGSVAVRDQRKALVKQVAEELEKLGQWKAEVWASQSSPVQRPVELEDVAKVQGKGKGKAHPVSIEVEEDEEDGQKVRIVRPLTSAPGSPASLGHHSALFSGVPVLDQIYPSPPSGMMTTQDEVVGYDVTFDAPAPAPVVDEPTSVDEDAAAEEKQPQAISVNLHPVIESAVDPTSDTTSLPVPAPEARPSSATDNTTHPSTTEPIDTDAEDDASSSSSDYGDARDSVLLTTTKDGSIVVTEMEDAAASSGDEYEVL